MNIAEQVTEYVKHRPYGSVFTHKQLVKHLGGHSSRISQSLAQLKESNAVLPIDRGLWQRPKQTRFGPVQASPEMVVSALERERNAFIVPAGAAALNKIGASTQISMKPTYMATKRIQPITLGKTVIQFKCSRPFAAAIARLSGLSTAEKRLAAEVWVALEYAGEEHAQREQRAFSRAFNKLSVKGQEKLMATLEGKMPWAKSVLEGAV